MTHARFIVLQGPGITSLLSPPVRFSCFSPPPLLASLPSIPIPLSSYLPLPLVTLLSSMILSLMLSLILTPICTLSETHSMLKLQTAISGFGWMSHKPVLKLKLLRLLEVVDSPYPCIKGKATKIIYKKKKKDEVTLSFSCVANSVPSEIWVA